VLTVPVQAVVHRKRKDLPPELVEGFDRRQEELGIAQRHNKAQYLTVIFCMDDDEARPRVVRTGIADETRVELLEGIAAADAVIVGPYRSLDQLKEGSAVKLEEPKEDEKKEKATDNGEQTRLADDAGEETRRDSADGEVAQAR
jgi:HlyD family secretion protein